MRRNLWAGLFACATATAAEPVISPERIKADLTYLASDRLEGRAPGSRGEELTIDFLAKEMKAAGLKPMGANGTFFQPVPLIKIETGPTAKMTVKAGTQAIDLKLGDDYAGMNHTQIENEVFASELVFVGHGITAPAFGWDDYGATDVKGKVVVLFTNEPPSNDPNFFGGKALTYFGRWTYKFEEAARRGAKACLIVHTAETAGYPFSVVNVIDGFQLKRKADVPELAFAGWLSQKAGEKLFALKGKTVREALAEADTKGFKPYSLEATVEATIPTKLSKVNSQNVTGCAEGSDPKLKDEVIIFTAHWDHLGVGKGIVGDAIFNGAADNGTGTALILELARAWQSMPVKPKRSALFLSVTAEEKGLLGSKYYADHPIVPLDKTAINLNFDMILPLGIPETVVVNGSERTTAKPIVETAAKRAGLTIEPDPRAHLGIFYRSDHFSMARAGVPAFSIAAGSKLKGKADDFTKKKLQEFNDQRYHQPSDEMMPDWDFSGFRVLGQFALDIAINVANAPERPQWNAGDEFRK
jgi:Zn-dependent M28 family amino/carboxypeptidase